MSTVGYAVTGALLVGGFSVVASEVINRGRGVELNQEESFKMGISAAISGAVMGAFGMANALKINIGAAVIGESATQIMDREFRPMDFGLTIGMEVIFYGIGKGIVKVKAMKAEGRSLIPKNIDVKQALKSATNKAKKEVADTLAKINSFKKAISKGIAKTQKKIADGLQNGVDEVSKFLSKINSQQFELAPVGASNNYKFECVMPKSTNPLYEVNITQFAAESTKKVVKSGKNFIDVKTTTKNAADESINKVSSTVDEEILTWKQFEAKNKGKYDNEGMYDAWKKYKEKKGILTKLTKRLEYLGATPNKKSKTGLEVIERMKKEGSIRTNEDGITQFKSKQNGEWYPLEDADMSHITDAVTWWNDVGRKYGAKSKEVRDWMLDSSNYYLEHYSFNRSDGAKLGVTYLPPLK